MKRVINQSRQDAINFLSNYDDITVDYALKFIDEYDNLTVVELRGDDFVEVPADRELRNIYTSYLLGGLDAGLFDSEKEFNDIVNAARIASK